MSSVQGITLPQLPVASTVNGTELMYVCNPSGNPSDLQTTVTTLASSVGNILSGSTFYTQSQITAFLKSVQPIIGEIRYCAQSMPSSYWLVCHGQTLQVSQYSELFAIIGNAFGGNGTTTFSLPNLQGRIPIGLGTASNGGTTNRLFGSYYGSETSILTSANLPHGNTASGSGTNYGALPLTSAATTPSSGVAITPNVCASGEWYMFAKNIF